MPSIVSSSIPRKIIRVFDSTDFISLSIIPSLEHKVRMIVKICMHKCESGGPAKKKSSK